ncbi:MAG: HAD hydrolase family protein [Bacteroidetes bacterium]|nr:HAD hydrolase family protein [Bacteroidota bacterium]
MNPKIKFLTLDVDGVLTDGGVYITEKGDIAKKFNVKDGVGIRTAIKKGIYVAFISAGKSKKLHNARAKMLGIKFVYSGDEEKLEVVSRWCKKLKISLDEVAHIADDTNDINLLSAVGFSACPNDAVEEVKKIVKVILDKKGGDGCVREFIEKHLL